MFKFKSLFDKLLIAPANTKTFSVDEYMKTIESGKWCDRFVFGISEAEKDFSTANFVDQPGAFYFGGTGSGKSKGTKFSAITRMLTNSDRDVFILMDPQKGMTDYKTLFPYRDNVAVALDDASKIVALIDMLYEEIMARKAAFSSVGASDIFVYEATMKQKNPKFQLARIIVFFEEFHATINSDSLKYAMKSDTEGTAAWKFRQLAKIARSYGLNFVIITQRCSSDDCPSSLKAATTTFLGFRVNSPGDAAVANLPLAADI
jgi:DNA segregation ATPase FtsK/SpoIIIE-like protein